MPDSVDPMARSRLFLILVIAGPVTAFIAFIVMNLLFSAKFDVLGFVVFAVWIGSILATVVGIVGLVVQVVRRR